MEGNSKKVLISILMAMATLLSLTVDLKPINFVIVNNWAATHNILSLYIAKWRYILSGYGLYNALSLILLSCYYYKISWNDKIFSKNEKEYLIKGLAAVFSLFIIVGNSFAVANSWNLAFGNRFYFSVSIVRFIGFYIFFRYSIQWLSYKISNSENAKYLTASKKINAITFYMFDKYSILGPFLFIGIAWLPYLITCYPGVVGWDGFVQLNNFFNLSNSNNHHPLFTTILMGLCMKIGKILGDDNLGVFFYILPQFILSAIIFAYSIHFTKRFQSPYWLRWCTLLFFAFIPLWPTYAVLLMKDSLFQMVFLCYVIFFIMILMEKENFWKSKLKITCFILITVLLELIRPNGIHIIILSLPFLLCTVRRKYKKSTGIFIVFIIIGTYLGMNKVVIPMMGVTPGGIQEMLSIPFQQTARYVKEYGKEVTEEEKGVISNILDYKNLGKNYDPQFADKVKSTYKGKSTKEDMEKYFRVWFKQFEKHPKIYLQATINGCYGYFYPDKTEYREGLGEYRISYDPRIYTGQFKVKMIDEFQTFRKILENMAYTIRQIPGIGMLFSTGFYTWILLLSIVLILQKTRKKYVIPFIPGSIVILICVASPVNAYIRYMRPVMVTMPLLTAWMIFILYSRERKNINNG